MLQMRRNRFEEADNLSEKSNDTSVGKSGSKMRRLSRSPVQVDSGFEISEQHTEKLWTEFEGYLRKSLRSPTPPKKEVKPVEKNTRAQQAKSEMGVRTKKRTLVNDENSPVRRHRGHSETLRDRKEKVIDPYTMMKIRDSTDKSLNNVSFKSTGGVRSSSSSPFHNKSSAVENIQQQINEIKIGKIKLSNVIYETDDNESVRGSDVQYISTKESDSRSVSSNGFNQQKVVQKKEPEKVLYANNNWVESRNAPPRTIKSTSLNIGQGTKTLKAPENLKVQEFEEEEEETFQRIQKEPKFDASSRMSVNLAQSFPTSCITSQRTFHIGTQEIGIDGSYGHEINDNTSLSSISNSTLNSGRISGISHSRAPSLVPSIAPSITPSFNLANSRTVSKTSSKAPSTTSSIAPSVSHSRASSKQQIVPKRVNSNSNIESVNPAPISNNNPPNNRKSNPPSIVNSNPPSVVNSNPSSILSSQAPSKASTRREMTVQAQSDHGSSQTRINSQRAPSTQRSDLTDVTKINKRESKPNENTQKYHTVCDTPGFSVVVSSAHKLDIIPRDSDTKSEIVLHSLDPNQQQQFSTFNGSIKELYTLKPEIIRDMHYDYVTVEPTHVDPKKTVPNIFMKAMEDRQKLTERAQREPRWSECEKQTQPKVGTDRNNKPRLSLEVREINEQRSQSQQHTNYLERVNQGTQTPQAPNSLPSFLKSSSTETNQQRAASMNIRESIDITPKPVLRTLEVKYTDEYQNTSYTSYAQNTRESHKSVDEYDHDNEKNAYYSKSYQPQIDISFKEVKQDGYLEKRPFEIKLIPICMNSIDRDSNSSHNSSIQANPRYLNKISNDNPIYTAPNIQSQLESTLKSSINFASSVQPSSLNSTNSFYVEPNQQTFQRPQFDNSQNFQRQLPEFTHQVNQHTIEYSQNVQRPPSERSQNNQRPPSERNQSQQRQPSEPVQNNQKQPSESAQNIQRPPSERYSESRSQSQSKVKVINEKENKSAKNVYKSQNIESLYSNIYKTDLSNLKISNVAADYRTKGSASNTKVKIEHEEFLSDKEDSYMSIDSFKTPVKRNQLDSIDKGKPKVLSQLGPNEMYDKFTKNRSFDDIGGRSVDAPIDKYQSMARNDSSRRSQQNRVLTDLPSLKRKVTADFQQISDIQKATQEDNKYHRKLKDKISEIQKGIDVEPYPKTKVFLSVRGPQDSKENKATVSDEAIKSFSRSEIKKSMERAQSREDRVNNSIKRTLERISLEESAPSIHENFLSTKSKQNMRDSIGRSEDEILTFRSPAPEMNEEYLDEEYSRSRKTNKVLDMPKEFDISLNYPKAPIKKSPNAIKTVMDSYRKEDFIQQETPKLHSLSSNSNFASANVSKSSRHNNMVEVPSKDNLCVPSADNAMFIDCSKDETYYPRKSKEAISLNNRDQLITSSFYEDAQEHNITIGGSFIQEHGVSEDTQDLKYGKHKRGSSLEDAERLTLAASKQRSSVNESSFNLSHNASSNSRGRSLQRIKLKLPPKRSAYSTAACSSKTGKIKVHKRTSSIKDKNPSNDSSRNDTQHELDRKQASMLSSIKSFQKKQATGDSNQSSKRSHRDILESLNYMTNDESSENFSSRNDVNRSFVLAHSKKIHRKKQCKLGAVANNLSMISQRSSLVYDSNEEVDLRKSANLTRVKTENKT